MPRYRYVLDEGAVVALLALDDSEIARLVPIVAIRAALPHCPSDVYG